jgi:hypothetical protein
MAEMSSQDFSLLLADYMDEPWERIYQYGPAQISAILASVYRDPKSNKKYTFEDFMFHKKKPQAFNPTHENMKAFTHGR